jgi:hypothetical protein
MKPTPRRCGGDENCKNKGDVCAWRCGRELDIGEGENLFHLRGRLFKLKIKTKDIKYYKLSQ